MNRANIFHLVLFLISLSLVALGFQNCGGHYNTVISKEGQSFQMEVDDFFGYSFLPDSKFYMDQQLFKPESSIENLAEFKYLGVVSHYAGNSGIITYQVTIATEDGRVLCPQVEGSLSPGLTAIEFDCVTALRVEQAVVELKASATDAAGLDYSEVIRSIYR